MIKCSKDLFGIYILVGKHRIALVIIGNYEALSTIGLQWENPSTNYSRISSIHSMYLVIFAISHIFFIRVGLGPHQRPSAWASGFSAELGVVIEIGGQQLYGGKIWSIYDDFWWLFKTV